MKNSKLIIGENASATENTIDDKLILSDLAPSIENCGIWSVHLHFNGIGLKDSNREVNDASFDLNVKYVVLPSKQTLDESRNDQKIDDLLSILWSFESICLSKKIEESTEKVKIHDRLKSKVENKSIKVSICEENAAWSSLYPDPKSDIFNYDLISENRKINN